MRTVGWMLLWMLTLGWADIDVRYSDGLEIKLASLWRRTKP